MNTLYTARLVSPIGTIEIIGNESGIRAVEFVKGTPPVDSSEPVHPSIQDCYQQLQEYLEGDRKEFDVKLAPEGTEFQQKVWKELQKIPFGKTSSYLQLAEKIADKNATRAVGSANGKNPIAIIVPCHRVIGNKGQLTGYAGGLWRKEWLLQHEGVLAKSNQLSLF
jgi:methylated-DNA-[protein]-cysteine S-methyltransferase